MKKLILLIALAALAYWLLKDRIGGDAEEFVFTEAPPASDPSEGAPADAPAAD